jgi:hypothetical protein
MKFNQLLIYQHLSKFRCEYARNFLDLLVIQKIVSRTSVKNILEIGYFEGLTFGVLYEASSDDASLTSCDITYADDKLREIVEIKKNCKFIQCKSVDLKLNEKFDFIIIDGDHSYNTVSKELLMLDEWASENCIIMIDDCYWTDVDRAVTEFLISSEFIPCLIGAQQLFLIRKQNTDMYSLIEQVKTDVISVSSWNKINYKGVDIHQYQYHHKSFVNNLKDIIKILDL